MTLEEAEKLAKDVMCANRITGNAGISSDRLARFILDTMPVLKAAHAWRKTLPAQYMGSCDDPHDLASEALCDAIDALSAATRELEGE